MDNKLKKRERWRYVLERRGVIREYMVVNEKNRWRCTCARSRGSEGGKERWCDRGMLGTG